MFNDAADGATGIRKHAAVAGWIVESRREQGDVRTTAAVLIDQCIDGFSAQQRHIAVQNQQIA